jgi:hypothetical protein
MHIHILNRVQEINVHVYVYIDGWMVGWLAIKVTFIRNCHIRISQSCRRIFSETGMSILFWVMDE